MKKPMSSFHDLPQLRQRCVWGDKINILAFSFGVASIVGQVALLREFMALFSGHEIIIGLFLSFWMLFTAVGAFVGGKIKRGVKVEVLPIILAAALILGVLILYLSRIGFVAHGAEPEFSSIVVTVIVTLFPVCFITGYAFVRYSAEGVAEKGKWSISVVYMWEQLGSSVGGGLLYLILVQWFNSLQIMIFIVAYLLSVFVFISDLSTKKKIIREVIVGLGGIVLLILPLQKLLRGLEYESEQIVTITDTPYGNVVVTKSGEQINVYENGNLRNYTGGVELAEESVHAIMLRHASPQRVLMIGGASQETFSEFKKYNGVETDYVDINPAIVEFLHDSDGDVNIFIIDPFRFLDETKTRYDVVILNVGFPHNLQDNRYFTTEFLQLVKEHLNKRGVVGIKGPEKQFHKEANYVSNLSTVATTGLSIFKNYDIYPGNNIWFIFFDEPILPLFDSGYSNITSKNVWFNSNYILPALVEDERLHIMEDINTRSRVNRCLKPVLLEDSITAKSGFWQINRSAYLYPIAGIFLLGFLLVKRRSKTMAVAGFVLSGIQLLLIYLMQIVAGNIYEFIGVLFALSMAGMALGSGVYRKIRHHSKLSPETILLFTGVLMLLFALAIKAVVSGGIGYIFQIIAIYFLVLLFASIGGVLFSAISYNSEAETIQLAGSVYGADLLGSSAGVLITTLYLIPVTGMINSSLILGTICLIYALFFVVKN